MGLSVLEVLARLGVPVELEWRFEESVALGRGYAECHGEKTDGEGMP
jgi:hypothetical protein